MTMFAIQYRQRLEGRLGKLMPVVALATVFVAGRVSALVDDGQVSPDSADAELVQKEDLSGYRQSAASARLVKEARLFNGPVGSSLEFRLGSAFHVDVLHDFSVDAISSAGEGLFRFDIIPDRASMGRLQIDRNGSSLYNLQVISSKVTFGYGDGKVEGAQLPGGINDETKGYFQGALETVLRHLAEDENYAKLLDSIGEDSVGLLLASAKSLTLRVYGAGEPLQELFEVTVVNDGGPEEVTVFEYGQAYQEQRQSGQGTLQVVALLETYKGSISSVVTSYLKGQFAGIGFDHVDLTLGQVGRIGGNGMVEAFAYSREMAKASSHSRFVVDVARIPFRPISKAYIHLKGSEDAEMVTAAIKELVEHFGRHKLPVIGVSDGMYQELCKLWRQGSGDYYDTSQTMVLNEKVGVSLVDLLDKEHILRVKDLPRGVDVRVMTPPRQGWLRGYLNHGATAFVGGAAVTGGVNAGLEIYRKYKVDGLLPHQYSLGEARDMGISVGGSALRGGLSSLATFTLSQRLPVIVAAAAVGVGNSLYDCYQQGRASEDIGPELLDAGVGSAVSAVGAYLGGVLSAKTLSFPGSATAGVLAGSLVGHALYRHSASDDYVNYDKIKVPESSSEPATGN